MKGFSLSRRHYVYLAVGGLVLFWALAARLVGNSIIVPSPGETLRNMVQIMTGRQFGAHVSNTLIRSFFSFTISLALAVTLGVASGLYPMVSYIMVPLLSLMRSVPTMAIIILALIWFSSNNAPILIGFIVVFPILYESVYRGMMNVDDRLVQMAKIYGVGQGDMIADIYFPTITMYLGSVIGSALGLTIKSVIAGEVLGQPRFSIGASLQLEKLFLNTSGVFAWIVIIVILSAVLEFVVRLGFTRSEKWK